MNSKKCCLAVHYVEAVLYNGINPFALKKLALMKLSLTFGPLLERGPWYDFGP